MKFSYSWLGDYVELPPLFSVKGETGGASAVVEELAGELTSVGLNVEGVEIIAAAAAAMDAVLDVEVTSNRPDCMSHVGLAREIAVKRATAAAQTRLSLY